MKMDLISIHLEQLNSMCQSFISQDLLKITYSKKEKNFLKIKT